MDILHWRKQGHPALKGSSEANMHYQERAVIATSGLTDEQWYSQTRQERAERIAYHTASGMITAMQRYDDAKQREAEREAKRS